MAAGSQVPQIAWWIFAPRVAKSPPHIGTVDEITAAIKGLSRKDREELIARLPEVLLEIHGYAKWERIIHDPRPRPALEKLLDEVEADFEQHPQNFQETSDEEFERNS